MRKMIKKVAVCAATAAMTIAMGCLAYAGDGSTYKVVGAEGLVGESWLEAAQTDDTNPGAPGEKGLMTETDVENVYSVTLNVATAATGEGDTKYDGLEIPVGYEFKILKDADDFAWTYQCCLGNPSIAWGDNQTQFKLPAETTGEVTIYVDSTTGAVVVADADKNSINYLVRWKSKDEDPYEFTEATKDAIENAAANPTTGDTNKDRDCQDVAKLNADLAEKVGVTMTATAGNGEDESVTGEDQSETITEKATDAKEDTTAASKADDSKDDSSSNTGVIVVVVIVVVVVIAAVAIVLGKKKK